MNHIVSLLRYIPVSTGLWHEVKIECMFKWLW